jgi:hypothetical protein
MRVRAQGYKQNSEAAMNESRLEQRFVKDVKDLGGWALKFISPGNAGVPDRLVILPGGQVVFVELKTKDGKLSAVQDQQIYRMRLKGVKVLVLYGQKDIDGFLNTFFRERGVASRVV